MGKNQGYKAMQRSRYNDSNANDDEKAPPGTVAASADGMVDASFHSPAWHAARIQSLTVERLPYEQWQKQRKEAEGKEAMAAAEEERRQKEYRALLDADRAKRLAKGVNHAELRDKLKKKDKKRKRKSSDKDKDKSRKRKKESSGKHKKEKRSKSKSKKDDGSSNSQSDSSDSDSGSSSESEAAAGDVEDKGKGSMRLSDWIRS